MAGREPHNLAEQITEMFFSKQELTKHSSHSWMQISVITASARLHVAERRTQDKGRARMFKLGALDDVRCCAKPEAWMATSAKTSEMGREQNVSTHPQRVIGSSGDSMEGIPDTPRMFGDYQSLADINTPGFFDDQRSPAANNISGLSSGPAENNAPEALRGEESTGGNESSAELNATPSSNQDAPLNTSKRKPRPRGRAPKDPLGQAVKFDVHSLDDLQATLRDYLKDPTAPPAEHTTVVFAFSVSSAFMIYSKPASKLHEAPLYGTLSKVAISVMEALRPTMDPKDQLEKQRSIAKVCAEAVMAADGFKYQYNNNWISKEDAASRFSYLCNDGPLNKGRAINERACTAGKRIRKQVYECDGVLHIKFSVTRNNLEVHYRHIPLHSTYAERAPPPRRDSKRRKLMEIFNPEQLLNLKPREKRAKPISAPISPPPHSHNSGATSEQSRDSNPLPNLDDSDHTGNSPRLRASAELPLFPAEKLADLSKSRAPETPPQNIPGIMQGHLAEQGDLVWKAKEPKRRPRRKSNHTPIGPLTEIETLKAKLAETETRLQRLEAGTMNPAGFPPPYPGQYSPYPSPYYHPHSYPQGYTPYPPPPQHWFPYPPPPPGHGIASPGPPQSQPPPRPSPQLHVQQYNGPGTKQQSHEWISYKGPLPPGRSQAPPPPLTREHPNAPPAGLVSEPRSGPSSASVGSGDGTSAPMDAGEAQATGKEVNLLRGMEVAASEETPTPSEKEGTGQVPGVKSASVEGGRRTAAGDLQDTLSTEERARLYA